MLKTSATSLLIFLGLFGQSLPLGLPSYMKACQKGPKFNDCILEVANGAIPIFVKGDSRYKLRPLDPLEVSEISVTENNKKSIAMNVTLKDVKITGLKNAKMTKSSFDLDKKHVELFFSVPKVVVDSMYKVSGKFLVLPITGEGPAHLVLENVILSLITDYKLIKIKGEDHIKIVNPVVSYETSKLTVDLKNLFNGDAALGKNMNLALNENWKELNSALGPSIVNGIGKIVINNVDEITTFVPYKEILIQ
ncbi:hypothetical protein O3M35_001744 [Rhynocoris fuscipes]|uniref:Uncharacterized protein n=1 Tax=Rhynocoris fuscipes TaxID=488301 RepID=A0AAW1CSB6_9HEMI